MRIPLKSLGMLGLFSILMLLQYQNCSSYQDPSPFEYTNKNLASGSVPSDVRLDSPNGVLDVSEYDRALSFGGGCNVGLVKKHYIEIKMTNETNMPLPVREDSVCTGNSMPADCFRAVQFRCEHGRYYVHLPLSCSAYQGMARSNYRLLGQLVVVNDDGTEKRELKASFDRFFSMAWSPGVCN